MKHLISAAFVALLALAFTAPAHAYQCKTYPTQAIVVNKLKIKARSKARTAWGTNAKSQFGLPWSVWMIANSKSNTCVRIRTNSGKQWRCLASAKPCLYVVQ